MQRKGLGSSDRLSSSAVAGAAHLTVAILVSLGSAANAQIADFPELDLPGFGADSVIQQVALDAKVVPGQAGGPATLSIAANIIPGWHIYSITQPTRTGGGPRPTIIELEPSDKFRVLGQFQTNPKAEIHQYDVWPGLNVEEHHLRVTWSAPIEPLAGAALADLAIRGQVKVQACSESCVNLKLPFTARLAAAGQGRPPAVTPRQPSQGVAQPPEPAGQPEFRTPSVTVTGQLDKLAVAPGETATLTLSITPEAGWHVYELADRLPEDRSASRPTLIVLDQRSGFEATRPVANKEVVEKIWTELGGKVDRFYPGPVTFSFRLRAADDAAIGVHQIAGYIGYQACSDAGMCALPAAARFQFNLAVGQIAQAGISPVYFSRADYKSVGQLAATAAPWDGTLLAAESDVPTGEGPAADINWRVTGWYMFLAFVAGLILNIMPCVLPVIGLKVMAFVQQAGEDRRRIFELNLWYVLGILTVFMILAALAAYVDVGWGEQFQEPEVAIVLAAVVFVFALSLLGVWEIPIPGFVGSGKAAETAEREGPVGAYCKGILTTILATPCSGPFLGTALAWALVQEKAVVFATFASMGLGMGSPYLLLGISPGLLRYLPKPGVWMETFKQLMGFVLLGTVVWIFTFVKEEFRVATLALLFALWAACWWFGRVPLTEGLGRRVSAAFWGGVFAALVGMFAFGWLVPKMEWEPYTPATLARLREKGVTVLVDFTADS
jgi:cytochrome c biogenesis protein CcdA/DsbC/DsbD-like thiol-disulfide interchange protein